MCYNINIKRKKELKMYNNLTVENLMKTNWFNQFDKEQQREIKIGLNEGLDVSWYAKKEFSEADMYLIRIGLEDDLDVSWYATEKYNTKQKVEILIGLRDGLDISKYTNPKLTDEEMNKIREKLKKTK